MCIDDVRMTGRPILAMDCYFCGNQVTGAAVDKMVVLKVIGLIKDAPFHRCKLAIDVSWVNLVS